MLANAAGADRPVGIVTGTSRRFGARTAVRPADAGHDLLICAPALRTFAESMTPLGRWADGDTEREPARA